jgi:hypothetical protein
MTVEEWRTAVEEFGMIEPHPNTIHNKVTAPICNHVELCKMHC